MSWGIFPLFFAAHGLGVERIGILKAVYPAVWGVLQIATGPAERPLGPQGPDRRGHVGAGGSAIADRPHPRLRLVARREPGARARHRHGLSEPDRGRLRRLAPSWRARSLSVYRFWRDLGYAIGALSAGIIADLFGFQWAIGAVAVLTFVSGVIVALQMRDREVSADRQEPNERR